MIYANSCSFGAPDQPHEIYPDIIAQRLGRSLINKGLGGSCNRRIIRTSLRDLLALKQQHTGPITALIGLTELHRIELWQEDLPVQDGDGHWHTVWLTQKSDSPHIDAWRRLQVLNNTDESALTNCLTDMILLSSWCKNHEINLLMWTNVNRFPDPPRADLQASFLSSFVSEVKQATWCIDPWFFSFSDYAHGLGHVPRDLDQGMRHPDGAAHKDFAEYLVQQLYSRSML